jgi:TonB-linked SusC/RagA family outer membrane protein
MQKNVNLVTIIIYIIYKHMRKILLLIVCYLAISTNFALAQTKSVQGVVVDENDEPMIGVSVSVVGTSLGAATDLDGKFSLSVPQSATKLALKYLGMNDLTVPITAGVMQIKMTTSDNALEEVVISVAYGTQKRNALTGAVTSLDAKEIEQRPITNLASLLEGKMGIMVQSETGQPGSSSSVRIRGFGSVNGSNDPLYVVDGFVYEGAITDINAADIAEMSVLKDASSAAIYGSRAANGVIIITTKRGNNEKPHISLTMNQGFNQRNIPDYERLGADQWMEATWMGYRNQFISAQGKTVEEANASANANIVPNYLKYNIYNQPNDKLFDANGKLTGQIREGFRDDLDWFEAGTRDGQRQEYILSGDGRIGAKSDYYFSAGYLDQQGYTPDARFKRFSGRAKINMTPTKWFRTGFNIAATNQEKSKMTEGGEGYTSLFHHARNIPPIYPVHLHDMTTGEYILTDGNKIYDNGVANGRPQLPNRHTIWENELNSKKYARKTMAGNLFAEITFLTDFKARVSGSLDTQVDENDNYENALIGDAASLNARISFTDHRYRTYTFLQQLTYAKTINDLFHVDILAAHENFDYNDVYSYGAMKDEIFPGQPYMSNFTTMTSQNGYEDNWRIESYLSRVQFNYNEKYFLDGSFRRDGSSRFYRRVRWGNFYSVGAAWNIAKEAFMDEIDQVNYLKLRANYGETGNDKSVSYYGYMALYTLDQNAMQGALIKKQLEALDIKWEASTSFGLALDGRIFDRLNFSVEYFDKRSRDLLFDEPLPQSAGAFNNGRSPVVTRNIGSVANRGFELNLDANIIRTKDFVWHVEFNATALKNKILVLPEGNREKGIITGNGKYMEGHGIYDFWTYQYVGVDQMSGRSLYELNTEDYYVANPNGAPAPAEETRMVVPAEWTININGTDYVYKTTYAKRDFSGSAIPKLMGTFSTGVNYKGVTLDVLFTYGWGNKVMDSPYRSLMGMGASLPTALHKDILKSWQGVPEGMTENSPNRIDRSATPILDPTYSPDNNTVSNRWLVDGSYLMFKNINLSYSLPKQWIQGLELSAVRLNLTAENLHLFSARKGLNSQMSFNGEIGSQAAAPRVISLGLKVDF